MWDLDYKLSIEDDSDMITKIESIKPYIIDCKKMEFLESLLEQAAYKKLSLKQKDFLLDIENDIKKKITKSTAPEWNESYWLDDLASIDKKNFFN
jgi:hypothetical protein